MLSAVNPCRFRVRDGRKTGTVPIGTIVYLQDGLRPLVGFSRSPVLVNPWIVEAFQPCASTFDGLVRQSYGSIAVVRSLRDGRMATVGEWVLLAHDDAYLTR